MSEIMAFHSAPVGASTLPLRQLAELIEDEDSLLSDISFSGGSLSDAINYLVDLGLTLIDLPLSEDESSDDIFGHTMVIVESAFVTKIVERIEEDAEAGLEVAEGMSIVFEEALEEIDDQECDIVIVW